MAPWGMPWEELFTVITVFVPLFIIVSPVGAAPLFLAMTAKDSPERRRRTANLAALSATVCLLLTVVAGEAVFRVFGVDVQALRIAGGIIMFLYSLDFVQMRAPRMKTTDEEVQAGTAAEEVGIVPLGIPMLAGPGAIATVLVMRVQAAPPHRTLAENLPSLLALAAAVLLVGLATLLILRAAAQVQRWLGPVALGIFIRIEGLILAAIAVQMVLSGVRSALAVPVAA